MKRPNRQEIWHGFVRSDYITALWNWFMGLAGKAAEPVLFASVLYSGYQLVPGVPQAGANVNAIMFVVQQAALDIGGMGLMKLAKQAKLKKASFPYCVGMILVGLMIANVIMASLEKIMQMDPSVTGGIEGILIVARAVMAVLFGHAIHSLKDLEKEEVLVPTSNQSSAQEENAEKQKREEEIQGLKAQIEELKNLMRATQKVGQKVSLTEHESIPSDLPEKLAESAQLFEEVPSPKVTRKLDSRELRKYEDFPQKVEQKIKPKSSGKILVLDKNLYTKSEAAKIAKCNISEIEIALENGELVASKSGEKILKSSLEKFVQDRKKFGQKRPTLRVISREEGA